MTTSIERRAQEVREKIERLQARAEKLIAALRVVPLGGGCWAVLGSEFVTADKGLAEAVALEFDRLDRTVEAPDD